MFQSHFFGYNISSRRIFIRCDRVSGSVPPKILTEMLHYVQHDRKHPAVSFRTVGKR